MTPRAVALGTGLLYALVTVIELATGELTVGGATVLDRTTKSNLFHWAVALGLLGSFAAGASSSRVACKIAGALFLALAAWGLLSAVSLGGVLGYQGALPVSYQVIHALTAAFCLVGGFFRRAPAAEPAQ